MKKNEIVILSFLSTACLALLAFFYIKAPHQLTQLSHFFYVKPCQEPIGYQLASIDQRFGISAEDFSRASEKAAALWSDGYGKPLFKADTEGSLKLNLVYSLKLRLQNQMRWEIDQQTVDSMSIQEKNAAFKKQMDLLDEDVNAFYSKLQEWNSSSKEDTEVYSQLIERKKLLQEEISLLNNLLDKYPTELNADPEYRETKTRHERIMKIIPTMKDGLYIPSSNEIEIYFVGSEDELVHAIAHEFGHSLGISHNHEAGSIMYPEASKTLVLSKSDRSSLDAACQPRTFFGNTRKLLKTLWDEMVIFFTHTDSDLL